MSETRGGTGYNSIASLLAAFGLTDMQLKSCYHNSNGGSYTFTNKMYIEWGKANVQADGNSIGETTIQYWSNYFAAPPFVFATINTASLNRHCSVTGVTRSGFTLVQQNKATAASTNAVYYLVIGYLT